jgi:hypothetical protein
LYALVNYPFHLNGTWTGKFAGTTGDFTVIGEADLANSRLGLRYTGTICFPQAY